MIKSYLDILPEKCIEIILDELNLRDFENASKSCSRLNEISKNLKKLKSLRLSKVLKQVNSGKWKNLHDGNLKKPIPGKRFGSTLVFYKNFIYLFGGATTNWTSFNDLWRFDLTSCIWERIIAKGSVPNPRACATGIIYNDEMILIGGFEMAYTYYTKRHTIWDNFIYKYNFLKNEWTKLQIDNFGVNNVNSESLNSQEFKSCFNDGRSDFQLIDTPIAASFVVLAKHYICIFGGANTLINGTHNYNQQNTPLPHKLSNRLYLLDMRTWILKEIFTESQQMPDKRCGHNAVALSSTKMLILGGWLGCYCPVSSDMWILNSLQSDNNEDPLKSQWNWTRLVFDYKHWQPQTYFYGYGSSALICYNKNDSFKEDNDIQSGEDHAKESTLNNVLFVLAGASTQFVKKLDSLSTDLSTDVPTSTSTNRIYERNLTIHSMLLNNDTLSSASSLSQQQAWIQPNHLSQDIQNAPTLRQGFSMVTVPETGSIYIYGGLVYNGMLTRPLHLLMYLLRRDNEEPQYKSVDGFSDFYQFSYDSINSNNTLI